MESEFTITSTSMIDSLCCPTCHQLFTVPIYQCFNGHSICKSCSERNLTCSECKSPLNSKCRNLALEGLLGKIQMACKFKGCGAILSMGNRLTHESMCQFNPVMKCIYPTCMWQGDRLPEHLKNTHEVKEFLMDRNGGIRGWNSKSWKNADWGFSIWKFNDECIINKSFSDGETFYIFTYYLTVPRTICMKTMHPDYGIEFHIQAVPVRAIDNSHEYMPFHISITEAEKFLLEPAEELEEGYKRLSLQISLEE